MVALAYRGQRSHDRVQVERGLLALERITNDFSQGLHANEATVGFEMIAPTLVAEAREFGLIKQHEERILGPLGEQRRTKLDLFRGKKISRYISAALSAEMAGQDGQYMLDIENLQERNGSIGHSPSATAYYVLNIKPGDERALKYLRDVTNLRGGAPDLIPFDVFEAAWVLWNFSLVDDWSKEIKILFSPLLDFLRKGWKEGVGIGFSTSYSIPDGDITSFTYKILSHFGESPDIEAVLSFEEKDNFRTYHFESHSSPSTNIHALSALRRAGFNLSSPPVQKILNYLTKMRVKGAYWFDKWHLSPYYTTAHAIIALSGLADQIVSPAIDWILQTQNPNGSWGYQLPSAEETAYCIQALKIWRQHGGKIPKDVMKNAIAWLEGNSEPPYPPLWIGKGLYIPELVVRSVILSALLISDEG
jgi:halimadienyl-diphosphate synthase